MIMQRRTYQVKQKSLFPYIMGVAILILLIIQVLVSNSIANYGSTLSKMETTIAELSEENQLLEGKIASSSSLLTIHEKAQQLGFVKVITPTYFSNQIPVALNNQ